MDYQTVSNSKSKASELRKLDLEESNAGTLRVGAHLRTQEAWMGFNKEPKCVAKPFIHSRFVQVVKIHVNPQCKP